MIDKNQFKREDWQRQFEQMFGLRLDIGSKLTGHYKIVLYDVADLAQSNPKQELEFVINSGLNKFREILFINRYNAPSGSKNLKIQVTAKCGKQLSIYPEYNKCYIEGEHEVWTFKLLKQS